MSTASPDPTGSPPGPEEPDIAGIVLAGGASRRMGRDKATLRMPGTSETLLERAVRHLTEAGATRIVVATGTAGRLGALPWDEVDDGDFAGAGPLAGMVAAARATLDADVALVLAVDLPDASPPLLRWLANELVVTGVAGLIPVDADVAAGGDGRPQPLHGAYRPSAVAEPLAAELASGNRRVLRALAAAGAVQVHVPPGVLPSGAPPWHRNLNEPLDLHARHRAE